MTPLEEKITRQLIKRAVFRINPPLLQKENPIELVNFLIFNQKN